jgi:hypothetical protein
MTALKINLKQKWGFREQMARSALQVTLGKKPLGAMPLGTKTTYLLHLFRSNS